MRLTIFILLSSIFACNPPLDKSSENALLVHYPVALREAPDEKSPEIEQLKSGDYVTDLLEVSRFLSGIYLEDSLYTEPWLRVQTSDKKQGWVFAGAIRLPETDSEKQMAWILKKRFTACFGQQLARDWQAWTKQQININSDSTFALVLLEGLRLRDTLHQLIARQVGRDPDQGLPDFFWLGRLSPYFIVQQTGGGTGYYLFLDYRQVLQTAAPTSGIQDDLFAQSGIAAFPKDSIESALPAWVFPLGLEESASNLGSGQHLSTLLALDQAWKSGMYFRPELRRMVEGLLADILNNNRSYWQPKEKILAELGKIERQKLDCLNSRDRLALDARQKMFEQAAVNELRLNLRSGK